MKNFNKKKFENNLRILDISTLIVAPVVLFSIMDILASTFIPKIHKKIYLIFPIGNILYIILVIIKYIKIVSQYKKAKRTNSYNNEVYIFLKETIKSELLEVVLIDIPILIYIGEYYYFKFI